MLLCFRPKGKAHRQTPQSGLIPFVMWEMA